jgi:hypothetical protein
MYCAISGLELLRYFFLPIEMMYQKTNSGKNSGPAPYLASWYCSVNVTNRGDLPKLELGRNFHPIVSHASCYTVTLTLSAGCGVLNWKWGETSYAVPCLVLLSL